MSLQSLPEPHEQDDLSHEGLDVKGAPGHFKDQVVSSRVPFFDFNC